MRIYGNTSTSLTLSDKAFAAYSDTDPLRIIEKETEDGYRYDLDGCISGFNLTEAEVNELLELLGS